MGWFEAFALLRTWYIEVIGKGQLRGWPSVDATSGLTVELNLVMFLHTCMLVEQKWLIGRPF